MSDMGTLQTPDPTTPRLRAAVDIDSHEMIPSQLWGEAFKEAGESLYRLDCKMFDNMAANTLHQEGIKGDLNEITYDEVWKNKGVSAPSAIDLSRRPDVLDAMHVERQLVFPTFALFGIFLCYIPNVHELLQFDPAVAGVAERVRLGRDVIVAHNQWAAKVTHNSGGRVRAVGIIMTDTVELMMEEAEKAIGSGIRALMVPAAPPPADTSPADPALDPFWNLLAEADVPITLHIGTEYAFLASGRWHENVEVFKPAGSSSAEFPVEPYRGSMVHAPIENYLCTMVLGGVFERHPTLRFGAIEVGAQWIGPLAERLDLWADQFKPRLAPVLSMLPSEYIARNVRATPYFFEHVDTYFDRYPHLEDVFCYSSDFPHREGGKESKQGFYSRLERFDDATLDRFFTRNGTWLLPS